MQTDRHYHLCKGGALQPAVEVGGDGWGGEDGEGQPGEGLRGHGQEFTFDPEKLWESQVWDVYGT